MSTLPLIHKHIHIIWIGDDTQRPIEAMRTWVEKIPLGPFIYGETTIFIYGETTIFINVNGPMKNISKNF